MMAAMYSTVEEITAAFKRKGWTEPEFETVAPDEERRILGNSANHHYGKGGSLFRMKATGNIFDANGRIVLYNIPANPNLRAIPAQQF